MGHHSLAMKIAFLVAFLLSGLVAQQSAPIATCVLTAQETHCWLTTPPTSNPTTATVTWIGPDGNVSVDYTLDPCDDPTICGMQLAAPLTVTVTEIDWNGQVLFRQ